MVVTLRSSPFNELNYGWGQGSRASIWSPECFTEPSYLSWWRWPRRGQVDSCSSGWGRRGSSGLWVRVWGFRYLCLWPASWVPSSSSSRWVWIKEKALSSILPTLLSSIQILDPFSPVLITVYVCGLKYHLKNIQYLLLRKWGGGWGAWIDLAGIPYL